MAKRQALEQPVNAKSIQGTLMDQQQNQDLTQSQKVSNFKQEKEEFIKSLGLSSIITHQKKDSIKI